jgi:hypothetical protein
MKKRVKFKMLIVGLSMLMFGCESDLPLPSGAFTSRLVVNGLVNNTKPIEITVSKTMPLGKVQVIEFPENADVRISDANGAVWVCSYDLGLKKYVSSIVPQAGKEYKVSVKLAGFNDAFATIRMPDPVSSMPASWKDSTDYDLNGFPVGNITVRIDDKPGVTNHYRIGLFYFDAFTAEYKPLEPVSLDADIEENAILADDGSIVFSDRGFDGKKRDLRFVTPFGYSFQTPKFLVEKEALSEDYYMFFKSLRDYKEPSSVFTEATPVFSNVQNGVGICAGSALARDTIR